MEINIIYALRKEGKNFIVEAEHEGKIISKTYPFQPLELGVKHWARREFEIPIGTEINLVPVSEPKTKRKKESK